MTVVEVLNQHTNIFAAVVFKQIRWENFLDQDSSKGEIHFLFGGQTSRI